MCRETEEERGVFGTFLRSQTLLIGLQGNWGGVTGVLVSRKGKRGLVRVCVCVCVRGVGRVSLMNPK